MDLEFNMLDDEWINNFERTDKLYQDFYKDDLYYVNLKNIYINRANEIEKITDEPFLMTNTNLITREEIIEILKRKSVDNDRNYTLLSILKYNINLEPDDIKNYLKNGVNNDYLSINKNIDIITFDKTINMFHDLNELILIFYEKSKEIKKLNPNTSTKKFRMRSLSSNKKTIRKQYKE